MLRRFVWPCRNETTDDDARRDCLQHEVAIEFAGCGDSFSPVCEYRDTGGTFIRLEERVGRSETANRIEQSTARHATEEA
jgi:hypothetical protein